MITPTLNGAKNLATGSTTLPLAKEIFADEKTSVEILKALRENSREFFVLESVTGSDTWGRYSFLGYSPTLVLRGNEEGITLRDETGTTKLAGHPTAVLRDVLSRYKSPRVEGLPPFTGGFVGYFAYDFVKYFEPGLKLTAPDGEGFDDFHLMLMDKVIAFDHFKQKIYLIANISTGDIENSYAQGAAQLEEMQRLILQAVPTTPAISKKGEFVPQFTKEEYCARVERAKEYIVEGDIFQVVLSNRFSAPFEGDLLNVYRVLRTTNPSPYMMYLHFDDIEVAGASPETMVSLQNGVVSTYPLAGTCPRGKTPQEDKALIDELLQNGKELAEHDMLVDLGRNDLGKVSEFGSVRVEEYRKVKKFSHVSHIASRVTGRLKEGCDAVDVICATLPAGTLSGAPKKRACEIIDGLEGQKRGVYGGALGYIDFTGNMDLCICIRTVVHKNNKVFVQAGAGIVHESVPENEYAECGRKAMAAINALEIAGGM